MEEMNLKIILGSKSPRRKQLLQDAGFSFEIRVQDDDEQFDLDMPPLTVAEYLAKKKGIALKHTLQAGEIILTADSVVILNDIVYNKPANYEEGVQILSTLSGNTHTVATGVFLMSMDKEVSFTVKTYVTFDALSKDEIDYYLYNHKPYDKAGAYGIQDWIGLCKVSKIEGSYTNIMGLPMCEVYHHLKSF